MNKQYWIVELLYDGQARLIVEAPNPEGAIKAAINALAETTDSDIHAMEVLKVKKVVVE